MPGNGARHENDSPVLSSTKSALSLRPGIVLNPA